MAVNLLYTNANPSARLDAGFVYNISLDRAAKAIKNADSKDIEYFLTVISSPCADIETIEFRREILRDLTVSPALFSSLSSLFSRFEELKDSQRKIEKDVTRLLSDGRDSIDAARGIMCANALVLKRALAFVKGFADILSSEKVESRGLRELLEECLNICSKPEYEKLCRLAAKYENYSTAGFMDFRFELGEGRVVSYSLIDRRYVKLPCPEQKKKGFAIFKKSEPTQETPCAEFKIMLGDGYETLNISALSELSRLFRTLADSIFDKLLHIGRQLGFYRVACALISLYEEKEIAYTYPDLAGKRKIDELYDLYLLLTKDSNEIVPNSFDEVTLGTLIIGGNGSGKTVFMRSIATAQILAQSGLPIPAKSAGLALYSAFASSFSEGEHEPDELLAAGRFEEEVRALAEMVDKLPEDSFVLLNEVFQSTAYAEGAEGLYHLLNYFTDSDITWMLVTHLTDLPPRFADDDRVAVMKTAENYKMIKHCIQISE